MRTLSNNCGINCVNRHTPSSSLSFNPVLHLLSLLILSASLALTGCSTTQLPVTDARLTTAAQKADYFQVRILTRDGKKLAATVYQPELQAGQSAPLIIATHGFGGFRAKRPLSIYGQAMLTGEAAIAAWKAGYLVVFYDQRGWGQSQGKVHMMDPEFEVADLSNVIDWSLSHLPGISRLEDGSPAIGMIGESYGGGLQSIASFNEPRLKAIVPLASWHDLNSLAPNGEFRTAWGAVLLSAGGITSGFDVGEMFASPWNSAFDGTISTDMSTLMYERSPASFCDKGLAPHADALFIQGFSDTIFPFQEAEKNYECWRNAGRDARVIGLQSGHAMPWPVQKMRGGLPFFHTDDMVHCGEYKETTVDTVLGWWDEKLRGAEATVPPYCVNITEDRGLAINDQLPPANQFAVPREKVTVPLAGAFEWLMVPVDAGTDMLRAMWPGADLRDLEPDGGFGRPKFIPLYIARGDDELLLGKPRIDLRIAGSSSGDSMPMFVGIGVQHANRRRVRVASEQLTPITEKGIHRQELAAVSQPLKPGDRVGVVVYGYTAQFPLNSAFLARNATVKGNVWLPLAREEDVALAPERPF